MHKIILAPFGSLGDALPLVALAQALRRRSYSVSMLLPRDQVEIAQRAELDAHVIQVDYSTYLRLRQNGTQCARWLASSVFEQFRAAAEAIPPDASLVVGSMFQMAAPSVAERYGLPYAYAVFSPCIYRPLLYVLPRFSSHCIPSLAHQLARRAIDALVGACLLEPINVARARLGIRPVLDLFDYVVRSGIELGAFDPAIFPSSALREGPTGTGFWRPEASTLPFDDLVRDFVHRGATPFYVGLGSAVTLDDGRALKQLAERLSERIETPLVVQVTQRHYAPTVTANGRCLLVGAVSHERLFRHVRSVVHHGGIGTIAAAAAAGVPQLIAPQFGDQFYNAGIVRRLGLGATLLGGRSTSLQRVLEGLTSLQDDRYSRRAIQLSQAMRSRKAALEIACDTIDNLIGRVAYTRP